MSVINGKLVVKLFVRLIFFKIINLKLINQHYMVKKIILYFQFSKSLRYQIEYNRKILSQLKTYRVKQLFNYDRCFFTTKSIYLLNLLNIDSKLSEKVWLIGKKLLETQLKQSRYKYKVKKIINNDGRKEKTNNVLLSYQFAFIRPRLEYLKWSLRQDKAAIKSKSPGSRHSIFGFKLNARLLIQEMFNLKNKTVFLNVYNQISTLINRINFKRSIRHRVNSSNNRLINFKRLFYQEAAVNFTPAPFFLVLALQIRFIIYVCFNFVSLELVQFYIRYGVIKVNKTFIIRTGYELIDCNDVINLPILLFYQFIVMQRKRRLSKQSHYSSTINPKWLVRSSQLPIVVMWRYPTMNELNSYFYYTHYSIFNTPISHFISGNPYWNMRRTF